MQAVILAAGRGTRMGDLTNHTPKPMLKIHGRPILEYTLLNLPKEITEVIIIIGYNGGKIKEYFGEKFRGRKVRYAWQQKLDGTAGALFQIRRMLKGKFLVLNGDDFYHHEDLKKAIRHDFCILAKEVDDPGRFGVMELDEQDHLIGIVERPTKPPTNLVNIGAYSLDKRIFYYEPVAISKKEFGLPQTMVQMARDHKIKVEKAKFWHPCNTQEDVAQAEKLLKKFLTIFRL
ncbi:MAG: hypothetical protein COS30_01045 [Candidatus Portnoybacteria bacterium CG02_land_8_20_14_3_00_45_8]|uniref:Nucleotidyl transferase domain-containing protein n=1 Tax=Candidatus Portnoybacteria bacterium CG02_land_8_20_14_3_00_45_8 TaxID=1974807 RepID=A0A2M7D6I5_9BACT|nr:MAG: hypothetical protein COS30_01045 [Candidatus Portnoybacteria bacterium CG02_land_8_20_14_3_00_45_8]